MFPALPGDPPLPEATALLALLVTATCACGALAKRWKKRPAKTVIQFAVAAFIVLLGSSVTIGARHFGYWALLKADLASFSVVADNYIREHGAIDSDEKAQAFQAMHGRSFSFGPKEQEVDLTYLWWLHHPQVGIVWGKGSTAAFDLTTMICVYSD